VRQGAGKVHEGDMIDGIIFDKDGTLFDFRRTWGEWAQRLLTGLALGDVQRASQLGSLVGYDLARMEFAPDSPIIAATPDEIAEYLIPHLPDWRQESLVAHMNALAAKVSLAEAVPLRPLLSELRATGLRIGLVTNDAEAPAKSHLATAGVQDLFDFIAGCDSGHGAKPAPGPLLAFSHACGLKPDRVVMVGDSAHDMHAGRAAGMWRVAVLTGIAQNDELVPHADAVLPDIGHLPGWISHHRTLSA
jgi:phosphoglycolate phosphatase